MKVTCINGSPRNNGSSALIIDKIIEGVKSERNIIVKKYCLGDLKINYCVGCKKCYEDGKCIQCDDFGIITNDLFDSDLVVIASPSYWGDITGQLKVFFDRNTPFCDTNEKRLFYPKNRKGVSVAIRAGQTERENVHIIQSIEHYFGHLGIAPIANIGISGVNTIQDLYEKEDEILRAFELGKSIVKIL